MSISATAVGIVGGEVTAAKHPQTRLNCIAANIAAKLLRNDPELKNQSSTAREFGDAFQRQNWNLIVVLFFAVLSGSWGVSENLFST